MGEVYRARQISMEREVALKILSPRLAKQNPAFADQFVAEARAAGRLNHPNIVGVHDVGQAQAPAGCQGVEAGETIHYFSMEFIEGETVKDVIERTGAVDPAVIAKIMHGMAEALAFAEAHRIVHRDIKPDNIMLTASGLVKLADLGLALQADSSEAISGSKDEQGRGKVMGTPMYMAPEQARALPLDHRADQYALGATLYHMLTGRPPYQGDSAKAIMRAHCFDPIPDPLEANPQAPAPWVELCRRMMAKSPDERYADSAALRSAVKEAARWRPGQPSLRTRARRGPGAGRGLPIAAAGIAALIAAVLAWWLTRSPPAPPQPANPRSGQAGMAGHQPEAPAQQPETAQAPAQEPKPDPAAAARARLAGILGGLPADPPEALAVLEPLLADPALAAVRPDIEARCVSLRAAIEERRRAGLRGEAEEIARLAASGALAEARTRIDRLPDEDWLAGPAGKARTAIADAEAQLERGLQRAIDDAADATALATISPRIAGSGLPDARRNGLAAALEARRQALLARAPPKMQPTVDTAAVWRSLGEQLEQRRGAMPYTAFAEAASPPAGLPEADREILARIAGIANLAQQAETALRLHIGSVNPKVECRFGNRSGAFLLTRLERDFIGFRLVDVPAETRAERATAVVPWSQLIADALPPQQGRPQPAAAAFLWYWRQPDARTALQRLGEDPLADAIALYERRTRALDIAGVMERRDGGAVAVSYPFNESRDPALLTAWAGGGLTLGDGWGRWATSALVPRDSRLERDLPTLHWKAKLRAPVQLEALVRPERDSELISLGFSDGASTIRIAINQAKQKVFVLATLSDNPSSYEPLGNDTAIDYRDGEPIRLQLSVRADGVVSCQANGKPVRTERTLNLAGDVPLALVLQGRPVLRGSAMQILSLSITGRP
jgi:hypothetical protein